MLRQYVWLLRASTPHRSSSGGRPRSAGAALVGVPALQERSSGRPRSAGSALAGVPAPQAQIVPGSPSS
jgi:hypothetical protein